MNQKQIEGKVGEDAAIKYLEQQGYMIICRNFRCLQGEIDIIAKDDDYIVFVEVKTRANVNYGEAKEAVGKYKQKHIYEAAKYYLYKNKKEDDYVRIDVIEVYVYNRQNKYKPYNTSSRIKLKKQLTKFVKRCIIIS